MVFLTAGLGGGTGTGASPIVAEEAAAAGALVVAIVTLPFTYEGKERMDNALTGLDELEKHVDSMIVVPNDRLAELSDSETRLLDAFRHGDKVLHDGVRAISELITVPGLINLDFADVRTLMQSRGRALMGIGVCEGPERTVRAAKEAINCPLLEQSDIHGAKSVIINIRGGNDMLIQEVMKANEYIKANIGREATIIAGAVVDEEERPDVQITVIASGFPKKDPTEYVNRFTEKAAAAVATPAVPEGNRQAPWEKPKSDVAKTADAGKTLLSVQGTRNEKKGEPKGQAELPLPVPPPAQSASANRPSSKMPPYLSKVLEKKRQAYENSLSKTSSARRTT